MTKSEETQARLAAIVQQAIEGHDLTDTEIKGFLRDTRNEMIHKQISVLVKKDLELGAVPEYSDHMRTLEQLAVIEANLPPALIEGLVEQFANVGIIAPTNSGGSTLGTHLVSTFLTGEPFLGRYPVNQQPFRVLFINPEEASYTPYRRLMSMGISREAYNDQYLDLHSQHARFYFNARPHVEKMLEALNGHGWLDDDTPKILIVDGLQPTLAGEAWNADLEAWKEGIGRLQLELKPSGTFVRAQTTASTARASKGGNSTAVQAEDVKGFGFAEWPDVRFTINRVNEGEARSLNVRGRLIEGNSLTIVYDKEPDSFHLAVVEGAGLGKMARAIVELPGFLSYNRMLWMTGFG